MIYYSWLLVSIRSTYRVWQENPPNYVTIHLFKPDLILIHFGTRVLLKNSIILWLWKAHRNEDDYQRLIVSFHFWLYY